jgi:hypothetical protein
LLPFRVYHFQIAGRHFVLLPKLNSKQMGIFGERLAKRGFSILSGSPLSAKSKAGLIHIDASGLCWSSFDPIDAVLPSIPKVLDCNKERVPLERLKRMYFMARTEGAHFVRLSLRVESLSNWDRLRASGGCGLAPDEHRVATFLIEEAGGISHAITDFPQPDSVPTVQGRRRYFESTLSAAEALDTLRVVGERKRRNSYMPRNGIMGLSVLSIPDSKLVDICGQLGDWCGFTPVCEKALIAGRLGHFSPGSIEPTRV